jgi:hypothetical protein
MASAAKNLVPNVAPKMDPKEQARIQAMIANSKEESTQLVINEKNEKKTLEAVGEVAPGQALDLKAIPTVYIKACSNSTYTINHRTTKIFIEGVKDTTIVVNGKVLTATIEAWRCENVTLQVNTKVKTLQLDISKKVSVDFDKLDNFQCVVWQNLDELNLSFQDRHDYDLKTGFEHVKETYPDSDINIDQFIIRNLPDLNREAVTSERCVRLKNGFLSTEREAEDWEKRNNAAKEKFVADFLKQGGIHLNKSEGKKQKPNEPCACGSGNKFKKCCQNKKDITGLADGERKVTYNETKK